MNTTEIYKAVMLIDDKRLSWSFTILGSAGTVEYRPHHWVYPHLGSGPLTCFSTEKDARAFIQKYGNRPEVLTDDDRVGYDRIVELWRGEAVLSDKPGIWYLPMYFPELPLSSLPTGTVLADSIAIEDLVCRYGLKWVCRE